MHIRLRGILVAAVSVGILVAAATTLLNRPTIGDPECRSPATPCAAKQPLTDGSTNQATSSPPGPVVLNQAAEQRLRTPHPFASSNSQAATPAPPVTQLSSSQSSSSRPAAAAAPYLYLGWGNPPAATQVMKSTGITWFTMAFVLAQGGCSPAWDGSRPLKGGVDESTITAIRSAGGDIIPSFGGWSGNKLGPACGTADALADAYQKVISAYRPHDH